LPTRGEAMSVCITFWKSLSAALLELEKLALARVII
jgi:hypothetical protein